MDYQMEIVLLCWAPGEVSSAFNVSCSLVAPLRPRLQHETTQCRHHHITFIFASGVFWKVYGLDAEGKQDSPESGLDQGPRGYMVMTTRATGHPRNTKTFLNSGPMFFSL